MAVEPSVHCPQCGADNPPQAQFCMRCGSAVVQPCPSCGAPNPSGTQFCLRCGTPLRTASAAERRVVTVLFADLAGSTRLATTLDPEPMRTLIGSFFAAMREEIARYGGTVEKFIGDAVMACFGLPIAHEDDAERAVRAALAMQRRMHGLNAAENSALHLRIAITTGEVVADPQAAAAGQFMVTGDIVNFAARLQAQAPPDGIVVDERTREATRHAIHYDPAGPATGEFSGRPVFHLKGIADRPAARRLQTDLVGRDEEMQFFKALYRRVVEGRHPHLVTVLGPAGVGKSRLIEEFIEAITRSYAPLYVLRGRCPAYGEGLTYLPLAQMLKQECGIKENDPVAVVGQKLHEGILRVCAPVLDPVTSEAIADDLATIVGVEIPRGSDTLWQAPQASAKTHAETRPATVRDPSVGSETRHGSELILHSLRAFLMAKAQSGPLVLICEDLHWAEQSLLELLERLAARGGDVPLLMLCSARPDLIERYPTWGTRVRDCTTLTLSPLSPAQSTRLITEALKGTVLPAEVRDAVLTRAEGNPFFLGEIMSMLIDEGSLVHEGGKWKWVPRSLDIRIPDTIQGLLLSRLDLLSPLEKRVLQDASVVGRIFWPGAIRVVDALSAEEITAAVARLAERDLVEERPMSSVAGEREFAFTHALIRDVAYSTLPKTARSDHHRKLAAWLEQSVPEHGEEFLEFLALHLEQAWRYRLETGERDDSLARQAVSALRRAARRATALGTLPEARRLYERALTVLTGAGLTSDATLHAELLTDHSDVVKWMSAPTAVFASTETIVTLAHDLGRDDLLARAWLNRAFAESDQENMQAAEKALHQALELFRRLNDRQGEAEAYELLGIITHSLRGRLSKARAAYRTALDLYQAMGDGKGTARTMAFLGRSMLDAGEVTPARSMLVEALGLARTHHERISEARSLIGLAILEHIAGEPEACVSNFTGAIAIWRDLADVVGEAYSRRHLGMHFLRRGKLDDAEREFHTARRLLREHGAVTDSPAVLRSLAELYLARGDIGQAAEYAERCLNGLTPDDGLPYATHRVTLARIRAAQGRGEEAEALFDQSLGMLGRPDQEYGFDLAVSLLKYGEALQQLQQLPRAREALMHARAVFAQIGAANFVREVDARLELVSV